MTSGIDTPTTAPGDEARHLRRPREGRMVAGVAAGLAAYFGLRPAIYRIAFAALALVGGAGILLYVVSALVIPAEGAEESIAEEFLRRHRDQPGLLVGLGIVAVLAIMLASGPGGHWGWPLAGPLWFLLLVTIAGVALWNVSKRDRSPGAAEPGPRRPSLFLPGLGVLLAVGGVAALLDVLDVVDVPLDVTLAVGLVLVGLLFAAAAFLRAGGLAVLGLLLALALAGGGLASLGKGGPVGDYTYRPLSVSELDREYNVRFGNLEIDLRDVDLPAGETRIEADLGIGELVVIVPDDVSVDATGQVRAGDITVLGRRDDGWHAREHVVENAVGDAGARLVIDAEVGFGDLEIRRAGDGS